MLPKSTADIIYLLMFSLKTRRDSNDAAGKTSAGFASGLAQLVASLAEIIDVGVDHLVGNTNLFETLESNVTNNFAKIEQNYCIQWPSGP